MKKNTVTGLMILALALGTGFKALAQTAEERAEIVKKYDAKKVGELKAKLKKYREENYARALELAEANGWPLRKEDKGVVSILTGVTANDEPIYKSTDNKGAARTARVDAIRTGGSLGMNINGQGMILGMWEIAYPNPNHTDFNERISFKDNGQYVSSDANTEEARHATHVAGTMIGGGFFNDNAIGIAFDAAELWSYNAVNDDFEALNAATDDGLLISNHSYGIRANELPSSSAWLKGAYSEESAIWDELTHEAPYYQPVISAGNDRNDEERDELVGNKTSKNVIVVAAVNEVNNYNPNNPQASVQMSDFSSYGPTDDKRIKPDICMKGVGVFSTTSTGPDDYETMQGTSMASPGVAGTLALMQQYYHEQNGEWMRAATLRGLMIHTADEAGSNPGPDFKFGWGLINATKAVQLISADHDQTTAIISETTLGVGEENQREVTALGGPLKVSITWTDYADTPQTTPGQANGSRVLVNDLDLRVTNDSGSTTYFPWRLNQSNVANPAEKADNNVDNVEVIEIPAAVAGQHYTIKVSHKGTLQDFDSQAYSLIVSGATDIASVTDNELGSKITVYPNPATNVINIGLDSSLNSNNCSVALYDVQGRLVSNHATFVETIDISNLSSGIYMLHINKDGATTTKKIIKK